MQKPLDIDPVFREQFERGQRRRKAFKRHRRIFLAVNLGIGMVWAIIRGITYPDPYTVAVFGDRAVEPYNALWKNVANALWILLLWTGLLILHAIVVYYVMERTDRRRAQIANAKRKPVLEEKAKHGMVTIGDDGELVYPEEIEQADTGATSGVDQQQDQARSGA